MNILKEIIQEKFDTAPFEVIHLHWNDNYAPFRIAGDFFFNENYDLYCIGMAGLVNSDDYIPRILKGHLRIEKQNRFVSESTKKMFVVPSKAEQLAIDYAKECGMNYLAKQKNGKVFAFVEKPRKTDTGWSPDSNLGMIEINIPISFLSFKDTEPYYLKR